jgi:hypothetical protein
MNERDEVLIRILGTVDAAWLPLRHWTGSAGGNLYCARRDYEASGVAWRSGSPDPTEQRQRQRTIQALAKTGLLVTFQPATKTLSVRLTEQGEARARAICGLPSLRDSLGELARLAGLSKRPPKLMTDVWICERDLLGEHPESVLGKFAAGLEERFLPALIRGLVVSNSTQESPTGLVFYRVTDAGWQALDDGGKAPPSDKADCDPEAIKLWLESLELARTRLEGGPAIENREIGEIPMPIDIEGMPA